jgi:hypothetical protein
MLERGDDTVSTGDVLTGASQTRRTLTAEIVDAFEQDIEDYARL